MQSKCQWLPTNRITTRSPFKDLFPIDQGTVDAVADHMRANGYDESQPIVVWKESDNKHPIIIDGHTRLLAALKAMISPVPVAIMDFPDERAALEHAIHNQRDRRNLTDADIIRCIEAVDKRSSWGGDRKSEDAKIKSSNEPLTGKEGQAENQRCKSTFDSAQETAKIVGTSRDKVKKARTILDHADEGTKQAVLDGKKSIHAAAKETQEKRLDREGRKKLSEQKRKHQEESLGGPLGVKLYKMKRQINVLAGIINRCVEELRKQDAIKIEGFQGFLLPPAMATLLETIREFAPYLGFSVGGLHGKDKKESKAVVELPSSSSQTIKQVWEVAHIMSDSYCFLKSVKPAMKRYCKHPLATEENAKVVDHFLDWAEAWQEDLTDILAARKSTPTTHDHDQGLISW